MYSLVVSLLRIAAILIVAHWYLAWSWPLCGGIFAAALVYGFIVGPVVKSMFNARSRGAAC